MREDKEMAEATRPSRARTVRSTTTKSAPKAAPAAKAEEATAPAGRQVHNYTHERDTKSYAVFTPPADSGLKGSVYAPLGTVSVRLAVEGPAE